MPDDEFAPDPAFPPRPLPSSEANGPRRSPGRRGGRRPGAGAPMGNLNGLKTGQYSRQVQALQFAIRAVPLTAEVIRRVDAAGDGRRVMLARALHHLADLILLGSPEIQSNDLAKMQRFLIRELSPFTNPIKQSNVDDPPPDGRRGAPACAPSDPACEDDGDATYAMTTPAAAVPASDHVVARSMRTVVREPTAASPSKWTSLFWRVRPNHVSAPSADGFRPSTRTSTS